MGSIYNSRKLRLHSHFASKKYFPSLGDDLRLDIHTCCYICVYQCISTCARIFM